ncbi:hypothetical protein ACQEVX_13420 [Streptomyces syringium]|uniref:hypothetical protein n=1 Tax=Streptomyces syringium TaxID=76729 RepID=UPI003D8D4970
MPGSEARSTAALEVVSQLREALERHGLRLPSLRVERAATGDELVQLGGARPDVVWRLVEALRDRPPGSR